MKSQRLLLLSVSGLIACGGEQVGVRWYEITNPPPLVDGAPSALTVPARCPIYSPGGGDVDTREAPHPERISILCVIDDAGGTYGTITGDAPTAQLAVIPGGRELGFFIGFDERAKFTPDKAIVAGEAATLQAWAAPTNVHTSTGCCAEDHPEGRRTPVTVAVNNHGWLVSLGRFDGTPTQVAMFLDTPALLSSPSPGLGGGYVLRFYVNGPP